MYNKCPYLTRLLILGPLFAFVEQLESKSRCLSFLSLKSGKVVHAINFADPVQDVDSSARLLLVMVPERTYVHDQGTLSELYSIPNHERVSMPPFAVSDNFVAFVDSNVRH